MFKGDSGVLRVWVSQPTTFLDWGSVVVQEHLAHLGNWWGLFIWGWKWQWCRMKRDLWFWIVMIMMKVTVLWSVYEEGGPVTLIVVMMKVTIVWMKMVAGQPVSFLSQGSMDYESCWEISKTQVSHLSRVNISSSTESDPVVAFDRTSQGSSL